MDVKAEDKALAPGQYGVQKDVNMMANHGDLSQPQTCLPYII